MYAHVKILESLSKMEVCVTRMKEVLFATEYYQKLYDEEYEKIAKELGTQLDAINILCSPDPLILLGALRQFIEADILRAKLEVDLRKK